MAPEQKQVDKSVRRYFLQSNEWAMFHEALGHKVIKSSGKGWQYIAIVEKGYGKVGRFFSRLYCPYGPYYENDTAKADAFKDLELKAHQNKVDYVRVEPTNASNEVFAGYGSYHKCKRTSQPALTLIIDLTKPFDELLLDMTKTNRYLWNKVDRTGLVFKIFYETPMLEDFLAMLQETSERTKAKFRSASYYKQLFNTLAPQKIAGVAYVYHDGKPLSSVLFIDDFEAKTRYYLYAGSFTESRKFSANSPLVTFLLKQAKDSGMDKFDFFGLSPIDQPDHRWAGFSQFKRSFGGQELKFGGTWEKPIRKTRYKAMNLIRKLA